MNDPLAFLPVALSAVIQDGANPPNTVPGLEGTSQATEGQPIGGNGQPGNTTAPPPGLFSSPILMLLLLLMVFMIFSTMMSARREKKRTREMLSSLKRGDRVLTAGGMMGTIHEVREDSIVLRVDDVNGAKAHFTREAIRQVIKPAKGSGSADIEEQIPEAG